MNPVNSSRLWLLGAANAALAGLTTVSAGQADPLKQVGITANQTDQLISGPAAWLAAVLLLCLLGRGVMARLTRRRIAGSATVGHRKSRP